MNKKVSDETSRSHQERIFLDGEGDSWFERNREKLGDISDDFPIETIKRVLSPFNESIVNILEIGCSNGAKLNDLCTFFNATGYGIDPSEKAITIGEREFPTLKLSVGTAQDIEHRNESFDLVYFGFCLYLLDRNAVLRAVAESDRVLRAGGFLAILDFEPSGRRQNPYHHLQGVTTFKNSYAEFFTAGGHYYLIAKDSLTNETRQFSPDRDERVTINVLFKEIDSY